MVAVQPGRVCLIPVAYMVAAQPGRVCLIPVVYGSSTAWSCVRNNSNNKFSYCLLLFSVD